MNAVGLSLESRESEFSGALHFVTLRRFYCNSIYLSENKIKKLTAILWLLHYAMTS